MRVMCVFLCVLVHRQSVVASSGAGASASFISIDELLDGKNPTPNFIPRAPPPASPVAGVESRLTYCATGVKYDKSWIHCLCSTPAKLTHQTVKKQGHRWRGKRFLVCRHWKQRCGFFAYPHLHPGKIMRRALGLDVIPSAQRELLWTTA